MKTYIYSLDCPITGTPKYIGKTINPKQRLAQHVRSNENTKKYAWIKSLKNKGLKPIMTILESFENDFDFWENWYIDYYRFLGMQLKNHKIGGIGGRLSKETKDKISAKLKGKKKSEEHRLKTIKNLVFGTPWNKGTKLSKENRDKAVKSLEKFRENNINPNLGKKRTEETKQKIKDTFKEKYGWIKKEKKFNSFNDYINSKIRTVISFDENGNKVDILTLKECKEKGYLTSNIINSINGKRKKANGFYWEYYK
jgi:hypothetical protein